MAAFCTPLLGEQQICKCSLTKTRTVVTAVRLHITPLHRGDNSVLAMLKFGQRNSQSSVTVLLSAVALSDNSASEEKALHPARMHVIESRVAA